MFAKRFFYVSASILCLATAFALGANTATAQKVTTPEVAAAYLTENAFSFVVWNNGDVYVKPGGGGWSSSGCGFWFQKVGNVTTCP